MGRDSVLRRNEVPTRVRVVSLTVAILGFLGLLSFFSQRPGVDSPAATDQPGHDVAEILQSVGGYFTENAGQVADGIRYYSRGNPSVGFRDDGVMFVLTEASKVDGEGSGRWRALTYISGPPSGEENALESFAYMMRFEGSNKVIPVGNEELSFKSNFIIGNVSSAWRTGVSNYKQVIYQDLYDEIDLVYRLTPEGVKYEFLIRPGGDPGVIKLAYDGVESLRQDGDGMLVQTPLGEIRDSAPIAFQESQTTIHCAFISGTSTSYGLDCEQWNRSQLLVIDPLVYSTYLGGSYREDVYSLAVDPDGNAYVTGFTDSPDFPTSPGSFNVSFGGFTDAFISKLNQNGSGLVYSTLLGGNSQDIGTSLALDSTGNAYVVGVTLSQDFPVTPGSYDTTYAFGYEAFVSKLSQDGSSLVFSSFLGGMEWDHALGVALDAEGNAFITGFTYSSDFPVTPGAYDTSFNSLGCGADGFVAKLSSNGSTLLYSTFLGGRKYDIGCGDGGYSIAVDSSGNAYVTGVTASTDFPTTPGAFDTSPNGFSDVFVSKFEADGSALVYSTYLGGTGREGGAAIYVNPAGDAYVTGPTDSSDFPVTTNAFDTSLDGGQDHAFITKLNATGGALDYSTYLGPTAYYGGRSIFVDPAGSAYVTGGAVSDTFPVTSGAFSTKLSGTSDAFVTKIDPDGSRLEYSTLFGGSKGEEGLSIVVGPGAIVYVAGGTNSDDLPVTPGAFDASYNDKTGWIGDIFVAKLDIMANRPPSAKADGPRWGFEGSAVAFDGSGSTDPENDTLLFRWDFDNDGVWDTPWSGTPTANHTWGDDWNGKVVLQVSDGNLTDTDTADVFVRNLPPSIRANISAVVTGNLTLRVAGEKWHDVNLSILKDGVAVANASVVRMPGNPDNQAATLENFTIDLLEGNLSAVVRYTPDDDPVNGQPNGANPAWLIFTAKDGSESRLHHTFNVQHNDTWIWRIDDLKALVAGANITFAATATDPGSDDLTFTWDWGDGTPATATTYFNDGIGPDPYPSPGGTFPFTVTDTQVHKYASAGTYTLTLAVRDDDGGVTEVILIIHAG